MRDETRCPIVVVDNEPDFCELMAEILRDEGHPVTAYADARHALAALRRVARPALVLLDWRMPVMDGGALLDALARDGALGGLTVVVCTVLPRIPAHPAVSGVLRKPFHIGQLLATIERHAPGGRAAAALAHSAL